MVALEADYKVRLPSSDPPALDEILELLEGADAFCPVFYDDVNAALIEAFPASVKIIAVLAVGTDNIDLDAAKKRGVAVTNTPDVLSDDTADLAIGLIISAMRGFYGAEKHLRANKWTGPGVTKLLGAKVTGKTLGIIGLGRIGEKVAQRARAFEMNILYTGPSRKPEKEAALSATFVESVDELVSEADVTSLHCPLTPATRHIINAENLQTFKPGSYLINTSRGPLVDENALVKALQDGPLAGAGMDVYELEPKLAEGLAALKNVTLLPHMGSATIETRTAMGLRVKENLDQFFGDGTLKDPVVRL